MGYMRMIRFSRERKTIVGEKEKKGRIQIFMNAREGLRVRLGVYELNEGGERGGCEDTCYCEETNEEKKDRETTALVEPIQEYRKG